MDNTIIDSTGNGVAYASPEDCITVGTGGLSEDSSPSSPSCLPNEKLGLRRLPPKDNRPRNRRTPGRLDSTSSVCSAVLISPVPKTRRGGIVDIL